MNWQQKLRGLFISLDLLNDKEITIYSTLLLKNQPVNEINHRLSSGSVRITRTNIYKILDSLAEKNLIYTIPGTPTLYAANNPLDFVKSHTKKTEAKLNEFIKLQLFVENELNPQLKVLGENPTIPIRKTYFLSSLESLKTNTSNLLAECSYRINIQAPLWFFHELEEVIIENSMKLDPKKDSTNNSLNSSDRYRLIFILDEDSTNRYGSKHTVKDTTRNKNLRNLTKELSPYIVTNPFSTNSILLVIDQSIAIFNFTLGQYQNEMETNGTGFIIHDEKIAATYNHQFLHRFRECLYQYLPKSRLDDLSPWIKENHHLSSVLTHLFDSGFKLDPIESMLETNYLELIPPKSNAFPLYREIGFQFFFSKESINQEIVKSRYMECKDHLISELRQRPDDVDSGFQLEDEVQKIIAGFNCYSINAIMSSREMNNGTKPKESEKISHPLYNIQLVVFALNKNLIVGLWSLSDKINEYVQFFQPKAP